MPAGLFSSPSALPRVPNLETKPPLLSITLMRLRAFSLMLIFPFGPTATETGYRNCPPGCALPIMAARRHAAISGPCMPGRIFIAHLQFSRSVFYARKFRNEGQLANCSSRGTDELYPYQTASLQNLACTSRCATRSHIGGNAGSDD